MLICFHFFSFLFLSFLFFSFLFFVFLYFRILCFLSLLILVKFFDFSLSRLVSSRFVLDWFRLMSQLRFVRRCWVHNSTRDTLYASSSKSWKQRNWFSW
jgi:hypothetical protein